MNPQSRSFSFFRAAHWVLLGAIFLLLLSFWFGSIWFGKKIEDTYNDPHRFNALKSFEQAIVVASADAALNPPSMVTLQKKFPCADVKMLERLSNRLQGLDTKISSLIEGKQLQISLEHWYLHNSSCLDVLEITKWLADDGGRRVENLDWSSLWKNQTDETPMQVPKQIFQQFNPWRGANGCVYIRHLADKNLFFWQERRSNKDVCPAMAPPEFDKDKIVAIVRKNGMLAKDEPSWALPDDLTTILADLNRIRTPEGITYGLYTQPSTTTQSDKEAEDNPKTHGPNRVQLRGRETEIGFNIFLTLDPKTQTLAQQWAHCYTGDAHACTILGVNSAKLSGEFYESAAMRMAAIVVLDVVSGKIEALGSAHTPCYKQDHDGPGHDVGCPHAPLRPRYDPDRLLNHALFTDTLPASTIKPIMALGFLLDNPDYRNGEALDALWHDLKTSNSAAFLDRMFCGREVSQERRWKSDQCRRPQRTQEAAQLLGWNLECGRSGSPNCAALDILFGRPAGKWITGVRKQPLGLSLLYGRIFTEPADTEFSDESFEELDLANLDVPESSRGFHLMSDFHFSANFAATCSGNGWGGCKGAGAKISNEGWGQGNARATPVGVAGMLARMAAAANGATEQAFPHLVDHIGDADGKPFPLMIEHWAAPETISIDPAMAALILQGMTSHQSHGTAHSACKSVFGDDCNRINWIAGKTGTPTFSFDQSPLEYIAKKCPYTSEKPSAGCNMLPYKWYVAAFKTRNDPNAPFDKVIAVLSERNWTKATGKIQAPGDNGINLSAEIAFRIIKDLHP